MWVESVDYQKSLVFVEIVIIGGEGMKIAESFERLGNDSFFFVGMIHSIC